MTSLTVLMSVYNGEKYIKKTIESIFSQTYNDYEFVIVNDGSNDSTLEILRYYENLDNRIKIYNLDKNLGVGAALDFGLSKVNTKYVAKADADDIYDKSRFKKQLQFLENNPDVAVVGSKIQFFTDSPNVIHTQRYKNAKENIEKQVNSILTPEDMSEKIYWFWCLIHSTIMARTDALKKVGYNKQFRVCEDYNLFYNLNKQGFKMTNLDDVLAKIRISSNSTSIFNMKTYFENVFKIKSEEIENMFNNDSEAYIWGAGGAGIGIYDEFLKNGYKIYGFIDSDEKKQGSKVKNLTIHSQGILNKKGNKRVIVASDPGRFAITHFLKSKGYKHLHDFIVF